MVSKPLWIFTEVGLGDLQARSRIPCPLEFRIIMDSWTRRVTFFAEVIKIHRLRDPSPEKIFLFFPNEIVFYDNKPVWKRLIELFNRFWSLRKDEFFVRKMTGEINNWKVFRRRNNYFKFCGSGGYCDVSSMAASFLILPTVNRTESGVGCDVSWARFVNDRLTTARLRASDVFDENRNASSIKLNLWTKINKI